VATKNALVVAAVDVAPPGWVRWPAMMPVVLSLLLTIRDPTRSRAKLQFELLALRHQVQVLAADTP
jgi:hypothetical protein